MVLGALIVTNEFFHQTATTTFLTTPQRTQVIVGKLVAAVLAAAPGSGCVTTAIDVGVGASYFSRTGHDVPLGEWTVDARDR